MITEKTTPMTSSEAAAFAPLWGSLMRSGDPGACMYGFDGVDGRPQNESHRQNCIEHMEDCKKRVEADPEQWDEPDEGTSGADEIEQIDAFLAWMRTAPVQ